MSKGKSFSKTLGEVTATAQQVYSQRLETMVQGNLPAIRQMCLDRARNRFRRLPINIYRNPTIETPGVEQQDFWKLVAEKLEISYKGPYEGACLEWEMGESNNRFRQEVATAADERAKKEKKSRLSRWLEKVFDVGRSDW